MLDQLMRLVEQDAQQPIIQNKSIPDQFNNAAVKEVTNQIFNGLKQQVQQGHMQEVVMLFQNATPKTLGNNPLVSNIVSSVENSLTSRFGISQEVAHSTALNLVPTVINHVIKNSHDPRNIDFDLQQMMRTMSGNSTLDISAMIPQQQKGVIGEIGNVFGKIFGK